MFVEAQLAAGSDHAAEFGERAGLARHGIEDESHAGIEFALGGVQLVGQDEPVEWVRSVGARATVARIARAGILDSDGMLAALRSARPLLLRAAASRRGSNR